MRGIRLKRQISQLINNQQLRLGVVRQALFQPPVSMRLGEWGDQGRGRGEQHAIACNDRLAADRNGQMGFANPWWSEEQHRLAVGNEPSGGEFADLRLVDGRLRAEVEACE